MARMQRSLVVMVLAVTMLVTVPGGVRAATPPANDAFASAIAFDLAPLPRVFPDVDVASATFEPGERWPCAAAGSTAPTVWYAFTYPATNDGAMQVDAPGAKVSAFYLPSGSGVGDLSSGYCKNSSTLLIPWTANRTVFVQIAGDSSTTDVTVTFSWVDRPANDDLANAAWISVGNSTPVDAPPVDTRTATIERSVTSPTQPVPYELPGLCQTQPCTFGQSVWYAVHAEQTGTVLIDPRGSSFSDVMLSAWNGDPRWASRAGFSGSRSVLRVQAIAGSTYYVQATEAGPYPGTLSGGGTLRLTLSMEVDDLPPVLELPVDATVEAEGPAGTQVTFAPEAKDATDGSVPVYCWPFSGWTFPLGGTRVTCHASDRAGHTTYGSFWVWVIDSTGPEMRIPVDATVEAEGPAGTTVEFDPVAIDAVAGSVPVLCVPSSGSTFAIGETRVWCSAYDGRGNFGYGEFRITVRDTTAPTVRYGDHPSVYTIADRIQIGCTAADAVGVTTTSCAGIDSFGWQLGLGAQSYGSTAADAAGNVGSGSTSFTVVATYRSLADLTRAWTSRAGVARDLVAILDSAAAAEARGQLTAEAGKLAEYRAAVLAQVGKSISQERAQLLVSFSTGL